MSFEINVLFVNTLINFGILIAAFVLLWMLSK